jgi:hypothetical protein
MGRSGIKMAAHFTPQALEFCVAAHTCRKSIGFLSIP